MIGDQHPADTQATQRSMQKPSEQNSRSKSESQDPQNVYHEGMGKESVFSVDEAALSLPDLLEEVNVRNRAVKITDGDNSAVLISATEYSAWYETAYLFRSPRNARRLIKAMESAQQHVPKSSDRN